MSKKKINKSCKISESNLDFPFGEKGHVFFALGVSGLSDHFQLSLGHWVLAQIENLFLSFFKIFFFLGRK